MNYFNILKQLSILLCIALGLTCNAYAQNKELLSLLDEYPEQASTGVDLYNSQSTVKIMSVDLSIGYRLIRHEGDQAIIKLDGLIVPIWVSGQYINQKENRAKVNVSRLNARSGPSIDGTLITQLALGYESDILGFSGDFVQIYAPKSTEFSVKRAALKNTIDNTQTIEKANRVTSRPQIVPAVTKRAVVTKKSLADESLAKNHNKTVIKDESHIIAPGDAISLLVFGEPDLSIGNIRVPETGNVSLPLIGSVAIAGQTTSQIEQKIGDILSSGYVKNPRLSVSIFSYRPIFIRGAVINTGAFPYTEGLTVAKIITLAGGAKNSAKKNGINILRDGLIIQEGVGLDSQYQVASGDVISVDEEPGVREDEALFIYLHGEVVNPGEYRYRRGLTVEKAIVLAGGFTLRASKNKTSITRYIDVEENQKPVKLKKVKLYTTVMPGDIIGVKASLF